MGCGDRGGILEGLGHVGRALTVRMTRAWVKLTGRMGGHSRRLGRRMAGVITHYSTATYECPLCASLSSGTGVQLHTRQAKILALSNLQLNRRERC